jgi:hypothetical protein
MVSGPEVAAEVVKLLEVVDGSDKNHLEVIPEDSIVGDLKKDLRCGGNVPLDEVMSSVVMKEMISQNQTIPDTRFSCMIQNQMLCKDGKQSTSNKRSLHDTSLTSKNSFAALDNEVIA